MLEKGQTAVCRIGIWCPESEIEDIFGYLCGWVCGNRSMEVTQASRSRDHRMLSALSIVKLGISKKK